MYLFIAKSSKRGRDIVVTAQEMFEQLGWQLIQNDLKIIYYNPNNNEILKFDKEYEEYYVENLGIDMSTLKAINKQCKELGWLDVD